MNNKLYNIENYGADYSVEHIVMMYDRKDLIIPDFQRNYVWTQKQASKFIESCILGLPIPSFFLFRQPDSATYLVVDGQQRIMTLVYFKKGYFKSEEAVFRLQGVAPEFEGRTYEELDSEMQKRFDYALMRVTIFKQNEPKDSMESVYEVFSRLNTGGLKLTAHEVRNAVIRGKINQFISDLNNNDDWRALYGKKNTDIHMKDEELIVRFFALYDSLGTYERPMVDFLNHYMDLHKDEPENWFETRRQLFISVVRVINHLLGKKAFRLKQSLNSAMCDSVMVAFARHSETLSNLQAEQVKAAHARLITDDTYMSAIETGTSQESKVHQRIELAEEYIFQSI